MKKKIGIIVAVALTVVMVLTLIPGMALAKRGSNGDELQPGQDFNGPHYNLNIIGAPQDKNADAGGWDNPKRHTIMVPLEEKIQIYMTQADAGGFSVVDADGTDGVARFELAPGYYEVYLVALGKPNKEVTITPDATFTDQVGNPVFALGSITVKHHKRPKWERVTGMFLVTVTVSTNGGTKTYTNKWVFDIAELIQYWWDYDNKGNKLCQVRFYEVPTEPSP